MIALKLAEDTSEVGNSRLDELIQSLREAKKHKTAAAAYLTEARSAEEYACYVRIGWAWEMQVKRNTCLILLYNNYFSIRKHRSRKLNRKWVNLFLLHCESIN